jgi:hypothetical protein
MTSAFQTENEEEVNWLLNNKLPGLSLKQMKNIIPWLHDNLPVSGIHLRQLSPVLCTATRA